MTQYKSYGPPDDPKDLPEKKEVIIPEISQKILEERVLLPVQKSKLGNMYLRKIAPEENVVLSELKEGGNCPFGNRWWFNPECPYAYKYLSLDGLYSPEYFRDAGHPDRNVATSLYNYMQEVYSYVMGRPFRSVIEFGTGGGEITEIFAENRLDFIAVEGSTAGFKRLKERGIPEERILKYNLKFFPLQSRRFDLAMCTEIAEHVEPFFASKVVDNCIQHSNLVWFSSADPYRQAHYHHVNEQPIEVWDNLFAHMGFPYYIALNQTAFRATRLYMYEAIGSNSTRNK